MLLTSDSARAEAERQKIEIAVEAARVRAIKEAALVLAEAQLADALNSEPEASAPAATWPELAEQYKPVPGREPLAKRRGQKRSESSYALFGSLPASFDGPRAQALVASRAQAKSNKHYAEADKLQVELVAMGVKLDDRRRTWSVAATDQAGAKAKATKTPQAKRTPSKEGA